MQPQLFVDNLKVVHASCRPLALPGITRSSDKNKKVSGFLDALLDADYEEEKYKEFFYKAKNVKCTANLWETLKPNFGTFLLSLKSFENIHSENKKNYKL